MTIILHFAFLFLALKLYESQQHRLFNSFWFLIRINLIIELRQMYQIQSSRVPFITRQCICGQCFLRGIGIESGFLLHDKPSFLADCRKEGKKTATEHSSIGKRA